MKSKIYSPQVLFIVLSFALLSACASVPQSKVDIESGRIPPGSTIGTIWISPCSSGKGCRKTGDASTLGEFVPLGANGLFIYGSVLAAHQEIIDALDTISSAPIVERSFTQPVKNLLESAGFGVSVENNNLYAGDLKTLKRTPLNFNTTADELYPRESGNARGFPIIVQQRNYDLSSVLASMNVDFLAVLEIHFFNLRRDFGPLAIPLTQPYGMALVRASLIDSQTGERVFDDWGFGEKFVETGGWRQPGEWSNVLAITEEALELAIDRVMESYSTAIGGS